MTVKRYQGVYLGFLEIFYGASASDRLYRDGNVEKWAQIDSQLAWSRDGVRWQRHPQRPFFLQTGVRGGRANQMGPTGYDWGMVFICQGIIERGDRLFLYYRGDEMLHTRMPDLYGNFCLATLRKDGVPTFIQHRPRAPSRDAAC
jgi:hypothetical protein